MSSVVNLNGCVQTGWASSDGNTVWLDERAFIWCREVWRQGCVEAGMCANREVWKQGDVVFHLRVKRALGGEVDGKLRIAAHARMWYIYIYIYVGIYILVYMCCTFVTRECTEDFTDSTFKKKGNGRRRKQAVEVARLVNDEENDCSFAVQR